MLLSYTTALKVTLLLPCRLPEFARSSYHRHGFVGYHGVLFQYKGRLPIIKEIVGLSDVYNANPYQSWDCMMFIIGICTLLRQHSYTETTSLSLQYDDVIMGAKASQITSLTIVYSTVYSGADQSRHQSSASLAFVWGIHRGPVNSPHKWPVTRKMFPFDDVILTGSSVNTTVNKMVFHSLGVKEKRQ